MQRNSVSRRSSASGNGSRNKRRPVPDPDRRSPAERHLPGFDPVRLRELGLSRREFAVLELVAQGLTNEHVARSLRLSPLTVKKHLERMMAKLGASNRAALVALAWQRSGSGRRS